MCAVASTPDQSWHAQNRIFVYHGHVAHMDDGRCVHGCRGFACLQHTPKIKTPFADGYGCTALIVPGSLARGRACAVLGCHNVWSPTCTLYRAEA